VKSRNRARSRRGRSKSRTSESAQSNWPMIVTATGCHRFLAYRDLPKFLKKRSKPIDCNPLLVVSAEDLREDAASIGTTYVSLGDQSRIRKKNVVVQVKGDLSKPIMAVPFPSEDAGHYLHYYVDGNETLAATKLKPRVLHLIKGESLDFNFIAEAATGQFVAVAFFFSKNGQSLGFPLTEKSLAAFFGSANTEAVTKH